MRADDVKPWALLLSKLRRSDDARVSYAEVMAAGAEPVERFANLSRPKGQPLAYRDRRMVMTTADHLHFHDGTSSVERCGT